MKKTLQQMEIEMATLKEQMDKLEPMRKRYYELSNERSELYSVYEREKLWADTSSLKRRCQFEECDYPTMGEVAKDGRAAFTNKEDAEALVALLKQGGSYTYGYVLEWGGPGQYTVVPSWRHDHDRDIVYTATFKKAIE